MFLMYIIFKSALDDKWTNASFLGELMEIICKLA